MVDDYTRSLARRIIQDGRLSFNDREPILCALIAIPDRAPKRGESIAALEKAMQRRWKLIVELSGQGEDIQEISRWLDEDRRRSRIGDAIVLRMLAAEEDFAELVAMRPRTNEYSIGRHAQVITVHFYNAN